MSIKAGQILHDANGFVLDRIQSVGGSISQNEEKIYELGNYKTVATVRDIPDLSFDVESFDVTSEFEALVTNQDPTALAAGQEIDLGQYVPINVISPFKSAQGQFDIVKGIVLPHLTLERSSYRFGVGQNASQSHTLRGDSIFYVQGTPYIDKYTVVAGTSQAYVFDVSPAQLYEYSGDDYYALDITASVAGTSKFKRLYIGDDYVNTTTGFTILKDISLEGYDTLSVCYGSITSTNYPQSVHELPSAIAPAAIRGKDVDVFVASDSATPVFERWTGIQSFEVSRSVNIENDEELGNPRFVSQEFDTAEVSGSVELKPRDPEDLWSKIAQITGTEGSVQVAGALTSRPLPVVVNVNSPDTGDVLKSFYVPDARFTIPATSGRVQQKLSISMSFSSDGGELLIYNGDSGLV